MPLVVGHTVVRLIASTVCDLTVGPQYRCCTVQPSRLQLSLYVINLSRYRQLFKIKFKQTEGSRRFFRRRLLEPLTWNEAMDAHRDNDSVAREIRCFELARRLIFHEVRTQTISKLTGLSRDRLTTLRHRLKVSDDARHRGPPPRSLDVLLRTARGRTEGAAVAALLLLFTRPTSSKLRSSLDDGEQACDIYDA